MVKGRIRGLKNAKHMLGLFGTERYLASSHPNNSSRPKSWVNEPVLALSERRRKLDGMIAEAHVLQVKKNAERKSLSALSGKQLSKAQIRQASEAQKRLAHAESRDRYLDKRIPRVFRQGKVAKARLLQKYMAALQGLRALHGRIPNQEYTFRLVVLTSSITRLRETNF